MTGWLPCDALDWPHADHRWTYTNPAIRTAVDVWCDGTTRPEEEGPCCADSMCPCGGYVGNYHGPSDEKSADA